MKKPCLIGCFLCLCTFFVPAQSAKQADALFADSAYQDALQVYRQLLEATPKNTLYLYRIGRCYYELGNDSLAEYYLLQSGDKYSLRDFYLAELEVKQYRFSEALRHYAIYLETIDSANTRYPYVLSQLNYCQFGQKLLRRTQCLQVLDTITLPKSSFLEAYELSSSAGDLSSVDTCFSFTTQRKDKTYLAKNHNGQLDLAMTMQLLGHTTDAEWLSETVNTPFNENYPFLTSDGITFYFSSDRPGGLGGYDIFRTQYNSDTHDYRQCENIGFPFNSPANDYMFAVDEENHVAYFATDRFVADSLVTVYSFIWEPEPKYVPQGDSLPLFAGLRCFAHSLSSDSANYANLLQQEQLMQPYFVVSDSVVFNRWSDFPDEESVNQYKSVFSLRKSLEQDEHTLSALRYEYLSADTSARQVLSDSILAIESRVAADTLRLAKQIKLLRQYLSTFD